MYKDEHTGEEVGEGWWPITKPLVAELRRWGVHICQIKEKFGGLRVYVDTADDEVYKLIEAAEVACDTTCEVCGERGTPNGSRGWIRTLCATHRAEENKRYGS